MKLYLIEVTFSLKLLGFKFSPLDFQFAWDLDNKDRYCYSVGYFQEVFDIRLDIDFRAKECHGGIIGWYTDKDTQDCFWRRYSP